jgi:hypothetical protein
LDRQTIHNLLFFSIIFSCQQEEEGNEEDGNGEGNEEDEPVSNAHMEHSVIVVASGRPRGV